MMALAEAWKATEKPCGNLLPLEDPRSGVSPAPAVCASFPMLASNHVGPNSRRDWFVTVRGFPLCSVRRVRAWCGIGLENPARHGFFGQSPER